MLFESTGGIAPPGVAPPGVASPPDEVNSTQAEKPARITEDVERILGLNGFTINFRALGRFERFVPELWDAVRECLTAENFRDATDILQTEALLAARRLQEFNDDFLWEIDQPEMFRLKAGFDFYTFILPKLLILVSSLKISFSQGKRVREPFPTPQRAEQDAEILGVQTVFEQIRELLPLGTLDHHLNSAKKWASFLVGPWGYLEALSQGDSCYRIARSLRKTSEKLARTLRDQVCRPDAGALMEPLPEKLIELERLLSVLTIQTSILQVTCRPADIFHEHVRAALSQPSGTDSVRSRREAKRLLVPESLWSS